MLQTMQFHTALGRAVWAAIMHRPKNMASEMFLPRRTAFVYDLDESGPTSDVPTTVRRSKADCPPVSLCPGRHGQLAGSAVCCCCSDFIWYSQLAVCVCLQGALARSQVPQHAAVGQTPQHSTLLALYVSFRLWAGLKCSQYSAALSGPTDEPVR